MAGLLKEVYPKGKKVPYKSDAQRKFMHAVEPEIAKRWDKEYPNQKNLPKKKMRSAAKRRLKRYG